MDFEELYKKVQDGTATEEEKAYVEDKIHRISQILDEPAVKSPEIELADEATVKAARKKFSLRSTIRTIVVVLCVLAVIACGVCGYIFGTAIPAAKSSASISREQAVDIAKDCVIEYISADDNIEFVVHDVDRDLNTRDGLKNAVYHYEVELRYNGVEYEVDVNAKSGYAVITDIDRD